MEGTEPKQEMTVWTETLVNRSSLPCSFHHIYKKQTIIKKKTYKGRDKQTQQKEITGSPMHLFLSEWSLKPSSHIQRLPRGVETQRWSHPPLFTSQTSPRLTSENINRKKFRSGQWVCWHTEIFFSFSLMQQAAKVLSKQTNFLQSQVESLIHCSWH